MNEINKYLNELELSLIFDDGKPGKVYALNPEKTSIYFIVDVDDSCLYVNQSILNIFAVREIKALLEENEVEMDIFPYFDDPNDIEELIPSIQRYFELLMDLTNGIRINECSNSILLFNEEGINIIEYESKNGYLDNIYDDIWLKIQPGNDYRYDDTQRIIKETVWRHFKNVVTTPRCWFSSFLNGWGDISKM